MKHSTANALWVPPTERHDHTGIVQICMANGKQYLHRTTLVKIECELSAGRMLRVHRSAIVNVDEVRGKLPGWRLQLTSGRVIRVGRSFREAFDECIERLQRRS